MMGYMGERISDNKLAYFPDRVACSNNPITVTIYLNNYCNNSCMYCIYDAQCSRGNKYDMTLEEFKTYVGVALDMGVRGVILSGGGEPTISPYFDDIADWLETNKIHYGINTNFNRMKYIKPDYLKISLDGWDEESYRSIRGVSNYEKTRTNILNYDNWRRENSPETSLGIQKVVLNSDEIWPFYCGNKDLPFDYMSFRPVESVCASYYRGDMNCDIDRCKTEISKIHSIDDRVDIHFKWNMIFRHFNQCYAHWSTLFVDEHGNVIYCCDKPAQIIGHILDKDISAKIRDSKTDTSRCVMPCRLTGPNAYIEEIMSCSRNTYFV